MDILVPITMKSAAKCDKQCELQNSANHQILERNWRWEDTLSACLFQCLKTSKHNLMCLMSSSICNNIGGMISYMKDVCVDLWDPSNWSLILQ